jgi:uncharacterized protein YraI
MNGQNKNNTRNMVGILGVAVLVVFGVVSVAFVAGYFFGGMNASGPEIKIPPAAPEVPIVTALYAINLRSGPATLFPSYGVAPKGATGEVIGRSKNGQWWAVKLPANIAASGLGWVYGQYVQAKNADNVPIITAPPQPPPVQIPPPPAGAPTATTIEAANIRSGPGTQYPAYGIAPKGAKGEVIGVSQNGRWWVVRLPTTLAGSGQGWVSADWVTTQNTGGVPVIPPPREEPPVRPSPPPAGVPTATALDSIHVRSGPGTQFASFGIAPPGASAEIIGQSADGIWWAIRLETVAAGQAWVSTRFVRADNAGSVPVIPSP